MEILIHDGQLFDAMRGQQLLGFLKRSPFDGGDQVLGGHDLADGAAVILFKAQIAVGEYTHQNAIFIRNRHAGNVVTGHQRLGIGDQMVGGQVKRIGDHAVLTAFDFINLRGLPVHAHVLMNHAHAAFTRHRDSHTGIGDGIHGS